MKQWEYEFFGLPKPTSREYIDRLNELGLEGWELVSLEYISAIWRGTFKRERF